MIKRISIFLSVVVPLLFLASCSSDSDDITPDGGVGSLRIDAVTDSGVDLIERENTRANTDVSTYTLVLEKQGAEPIIVGKLPSDGVVRDIPAGEYNVRLASHYDYFTPVFEAPTYEGVQEGVTIEGGKTTSVSLTCEQSNAGVYFVYDASLEEVGGFSNVIPTVTQGESALVFQGDQKESRGYFHAKPAILTLNDGGKPLTINGVKEQVLQLGARQLWEITLAVSIAEDGKLVVTATVKVIDAPTNKVEFEVELESGSEDNPLTVSMLPNLVGSKEVWVEGYVVNPPTTLRSAEGSTKNYIYLADEATESNLANCARIELEEGSEIQARLNIVDHPGLVGEKVSVKGDIAEGIDGEKAKMENITAEKGGREPIEEPELPVGDVEIDKMYGYAAWAGTTGGDDAAQQNIHHFDDGYKLRDWLKLREKNKDKTAAIVWLSGTFTKEMGRGGSSPWFDIKDTDNISFYGTDDFVMDRIGFFIVRSNNIIIRNVYFRMPKADSGADAVSMQKSSKVWVDHCSFESLNQVKDYEDGSCDITHGTHSVTVSWNHFITTQKSCLVGHSNSETNDKQITVTFHHNFFDKSRSRHPRVRFGAAHVYNNFFNAVDTYGVGSAYGAKVLVENNYFDAVRLPIDICTYPAKKSGNSWVSNLTGSVAGYVYEHGNAFDNRPSNATDPYPFINLEYKAYEGEKLATPLTYEDFRPPYDYDINAAADVRALVEQYSGVGALEGFESAPVEVNNGNMPDTEEPEEPVDPDEPEEGVDLEGGWSIVSQGAASASSFITEEGSLILTALGKYESGAQEFGFVYREITGDFEMTAKIENYESVGGNQGLFGLLLTPELGLEGTEFLYAVGGVDGKGDFHGRGRVEAGKNGGRSGLGSVTGDDLYVKIRRVGDVAYVDFSIDGGVSYVKEKNYAFSAGLPESVYVGIALNSASNKTVSGTVSNVVLNNEPLSFTDNE